MKKRILCLLLAVAMVCMVGMTGCAKRDNKKSKNTTITVSSVDAKVGKNVKVPVEISGNPGVMALLIDFTYDNKKLEYVGFDKGNVFSDYEINENDGTLRLICVEDKDIKKDGKLLTLEFKVVSKDAGKTEVGVVLEDNSMCNYDEELIKATGKNGTVKIKK